jgi:hypothetical protein
LLWILAGGALAAVVCCGAVGVMGWRFMSQMATSDPAEIRRQSAEMLDMTIPPQYQPMQGMNMGIVRMIMYQTEPAADGTRGMLMLMEMGMQNLGVDAEQQKQELRKAAQQQQANQNVQQMKSETREIEIGGEQVPFQFSEATPQGQAKKMYIVNGVVEGKRGPVMVQVMLPEDQYDEAAVVQMLQSIK